MFFCSLFCFHIHCSIVLQSLTCRVNVWLFVSADSTVDTLPCAPASHTSVLKPCTQSVSVSILRFLELTSETDLLMLLCLVHLSLLSQLIRKHWIIQRLSEVPQQPQIRNPFKMLYQRKVQWSFCCVHLQKLRQLKLELYRWWIKFCLRWEKKSDERQSLFSAPENQTVLSSLGSVSAAFQREPLPQMKTFIQVDPYRRGLLCLCSTSRMHYRPITHKTFTSGKQSNWKAPFQWVWDEYLCMWENEYHFSHKWISALKLEVREMAEIILLLLNWSQLLIRLAIITRLRNNSRFLKLFNIVR